MSLFGALNIGSSSLATQQLALQVTGNNMANANTPGYTRQTANITTSAAQQVGNGQYIGGGATVSSIDRQVNEALNSSLRDANSAQQQSSSLSTLLNQVQTTFGTLNDNDLSSRLSDFFNNFSTLANNPSDSGQQSVVLSSGSTLAGYLQTLNSQLGQIRTSDNTEVGQLASQANSLLQSVATLNGQISTAESSGGTPNDLMDQRDQALTQLSQLINIHTNLGTNGQINVSIGSQTLVQGNASRGIATQTSTDPTDTYSITNLVTGDSSAAPITATGGEIGGLINARDGAISTAINTVNQVASALINTVNSISSQGQGSVGFTDVTGSNAVTDPTAPLNGAPSATGLPTVPVNGTFNITVQNATTGQPTTAQIVVNFNGTPPTSLNSVVSSINSANLGVTASVDPTGHLEIKSNSANNSFTFSNDTSGVLASLGVNTFFTGKDATNISVNQTLTQNPGLVATGQGNIPGSNANALAMAQALTNPSTQLGGQSLQGFYTNYVGSLATAAAAASDDDSANTIIQSNLSSQQQAISGVSMDEEAINMTMFQRAYEGSAKYVSVVDEMMQTVIAMVTT